MTPLMEQYWSVKNQHPDKIILFRMGDFFEMFHRDAETAAPILGIALTSRNKKSGDDTKMCGVPHHSIAGPIGKLLAAGFKVAICDQVEDPKFAKGLVKRAVTRVLTPGLVYDPETLDQLSVNYLAAYDDHALAFLEPTTGECFYFRTQDEEQRHRLLLLQKPVEIVLREDQRERWKQASLFQEDPHLSFFEIEEGSESVPAAARRLLNYLKTMQGESAWAALSPFREKKLQWSLEMSSTTQKHLELFETYKGDRRGSLFHAMNRTLTSAGGRRLKEWLQFPLVDRVAIEARWESIATWMQRSDELKRVRDLLRDMGDVERRLGKIANPNCNARDLIALAESLERGVALAPFSEDVEESLNNYAMNLAQQILATIENSPPLTIKEGGLIQRGVRDDLDELIDLSENSQRLLLDLETREREASGISSLKIRYNSVFGFYIEITKTHAKKAPAHYQRKQTLANAERYTTEELHALEEKILAARGRRNELEYEIFREVQREVLTAVPDLLRLASGWSELDVLTSFAWLSLEQNYCRPQWSVGGELKLAASRHPVIEQDKTVHFIANDIHLDRSGCLLLTGPNMAGKSTIMRQVALTSILAQVGCFVPASAAHIPCVDRIFTRIGASDFLTEGLSTFMVEMKETAEILRWATADSLIVMDEIGRGTSTYDGMSLAQAILEYLVSQTKAYCLFATHYHELTVLKDLFPRIQNAHMSVAESRGQIKFLHTLTAGPANKSYGVQVARLAGLPPTVVKRAAEILVQLEKREGGREQLDLFAPTVERPLEPEVSLHESHDQIVEALKSVSVNELTPMEALNRIAEWQRHLI